MMIRVKNLALIFAIIGCSYPAYAMHEEKDECGHTVQQQPRLEPIKPFDWSHVLVIPPGAGINEGSQIMHFKSRNKPYGDSSEATLFVEQNLSRATKLSSDAEVLKFGSDSVTIENGWFLEMGVCTGKTVNFIAGLNPHKIVHGFDSFKGLPEPWIRRDRTFEQGTFSFREGQPIPRSYTM